MTTEQKAGTSIGQGLDQVRAEQFAGELVQKLNGAAALMISIGNQTGLFDSATCASGWARW